MLLVRGEVQVNVLTKIYLVAFVAMLVVTKREVYDENTTDK